MMLSVTSAPPSPAERVQEEKIVREAEKKKPSQPHLFFFLPNEMTCTGEFFTVLNG